MSSVTESSVRLPMVTPLSSRSPSPPLSTSPSSPSSSSPHTAKHRVVVAFMPLKLARCMSEAKATVPPSSTPLSCRVKTSTAAFASAEGTRSEKGSLSLGCARGAGQRGERR